MQDFRYYLYHLFLLSARAVKISSVEVHTIFTHMHPPVWVHHMHSHLLLLNFSVDSTLRDVLKLHLVPHRHNPVFQGINTVWGKTLTTGLWEPIEKYSQLVLRCISSSFSHSYIESEIVHPQYSQPDNTSWYWLHLLFFFVILSSPITFLGLRVFPFAF